MCPPLGSRIRTCTSPAFNCFVQSALLSPVSHKKIIGSRCLIFLPYPRQTYLLIFAQSDLNFDIFLPLLEPLTHSLTHSLRYTETLLKEQRVIVCAPILAACVPACVFTLSGSRSKSRLLQWFNIERRGGSLRDLKACDLQACDGY
jgi:hypothetical protein